MNKVVTGALAQVGVGRKQTQTIYVDKRYPIEGRKDFFKWVIVTPTGLAKDFEGKEIWLDSYDQAKRICLAKRRVTKRNER